jgi:DNA helicase IV
MGDPDEPVAFGRFQTEDEVLYIGKQSIMDENRDSLVINWRLPIAEAFYRCSFKDPMGVLAKRQFKTEKNTVLDFDEMVLQDLAERVEALTTSEQFGVDDAVLREFETERTGEMHDIVQTIHAAQYDLIRAPHNQLMIIQGGPGTGKTVVALHRVSWLLFNHSDELQPERILVIGPNETFRRYISSVLPGLGDANVAHQDLRGLGPQRASAAETDAETERLKGDERMARLLRAALRQRIRIADQSPTFDVGGLNGARLQRAAVENALNNAASAATYNTGRAQFRNWLQTRSAEAASDKQAITASAIDNALDRAYPQLTSQAFLRELLGSRERLAAAAGDDFTAADVGRLFRQAAPRLSEERWTNADIALLDEADVLINGTPDKFDHIVVDEAQDLSPMQLRSVARRSANGSMTVVGDIAQSTGPWASDSWDDVADALASAAPCERHNLELGYRVPEQVYAFAQLLLPHAAPSVVAPRVVRRGPADPALIEVDALDLAEEAVKAAREYAGSGLFVGLICPDSVRPGVVDELRRRNVRYADARTGHLGTSINLASPEESKGLEFDAVVVVDPETIAADPARGLRKLYVALTRTTRYLTVVHTGRAMPTPSADEPIPTEWPASAADEAMPTAEPPIRRTLDSPVPVVPESTVARRATRDVVVDAVAGAVEQDLRDSALPKQWAAILEEVRRRLGIDS